MRLLEILNVFVDSGALLRDPSRAFASLNQLSRRAHHSDDKIRRAIAALSKEACDPLVEVKNRRWGLTTKGGIVHTQAERLLAAFRDRSEADPVEVLEVAIADGVNPEIVAQAAKAFFWEWERFPITLRIQRLDPDTLPESLRSGSIAFALGWEGEEIGAGSHEPLEPGARWHALVSQSHPLAKQEGSIEASSLSEARIFLSPASDVPALSSLLAGSPSARVRVESLAAARAMVASGLGVSLELAFGDSDDCESLRRLPIAGLGPQRLCLYPPANKDDMSEPAAFFKAALKDAIREAALPPIPPAIEAFGEIAEIPPLPQAAV